MTVQIPEPNLKGIKRPYIQYWFLLQKAALLNPDATQDDKNIARQYVFYYDEELKRRDRKNRNQRNRLRKAKALT